MAATGEVLSETPDGPDLTAEQEALLWTQAEPLLTQLKHSSKEESVMFLPDFGSTAGLMMGAAVIVAASPVQAADNYMLGICKISQPGSGAEINPTINGNIYLYDYHASDPRYQGFSFNSSDTKVTLVKAPTHGKVEQGSTEISNNYYHYMPIEGYTGQDRFVIQVEKNGVKVRIQYLLEVPLEDEPTGHMCNPEHWKISSTTPALDNASLQALLGAANIDNSVNIAFSDLTGGAIGQATGTSITLDTNAANYNWFIDASPLDNSEFLPTSNPYEWVAKEGSAAYGKMDMLSVLLHEYGHALGIEHSADSHDYMATTLTAGVRRMPSAEELALMQSLVAQAKDTLTESTLSPSLPLQGGGGFPTVPLGTSFIGFLGLLRGSRYGGASIVPDTSTLVTQYAWAANPALTNGSLNSGAGWSTQGGVDIGNGAATLSEVSGSQTRLSQAFLLNPTDRFLSFTLAGTALDDLSGAHPLPNPPPGGEGTNGTAFGSDYGPSDAFEVALLDANSGASLLGSNGLTRTDAFLNTRKEYAGGGPAA